MRHFRPKGVALYGKSRGTFCPNYLHPQPAPHIPRFPPGKDKKEKRPRPGLSACKKKVQQTLNLFNFTGVEFLIYHSISKESNTFETISTT
jgi:hypothetical protein